MYSSPNQQLLCQHSTKAARSDIEYAMQFSYVVIPNTGVFSVYLMDLSFDDCMYYSGSFKSWRPQVHVPLKV